MNNKQQQHITEEATIIADKNTKEILERVIRRVEKEKTASLVNTYTEFPEHQDFNEHVNVG